MEERKEVKESKIKEAEDKQDLPIKILLMGKPGVGKTSLNSIIFKSYNPQDTFRFGSTCEIEEAHIHSINNSRITVLDCGGKEEYTKLYFSTKKNLIFSNVSALVFVVQAIENNAAKNEADNELTLFEK